METYGWWDQVPENLKTKTALAADGLKPGGDPAARIEYGRGRRHRIYNLYDAKAAHQKQQATPAQLAALEAARLAQRTCPRCKTVVASKTALDPELGICDSCYAVREGNIHVGARDEAIRVARKLMAWPGLLILDTETTGLEGEIVEIGVIRTDGSMAYHSLVRPRDEMGATEIHGITADMVANAPTFADIEPQLRALLHGRKVAVYNVPFDRGMLWGGVYSMYKAELPPAPEPVPAALLGPAHSTQDAWLSPRAVKQRDENQAWQVAADEALAAAERWTNAITWRCVMRVYAKYVGEWNEFHGDYKWQRLPRGGHRALDDCQATLRMLREMASAPLSTESTLSVVGA